MAGGFAMASGGKTSNLPPPSKTSWLLIALTVMAVMGGFLFGYDTGIVSGAMIIIRVHFGLDDLWQELIVSATVGAAAVGSLAAGFLNTKFGRKWTILGSSLLFIIGSLILAFAPNKEVLLVGRIVLGLAIGVSSSTIPAYVAECSPPHVRGRMITMFQLLITFGFWVAGLLAGALSYIDDNNLNWRIMLGLAALPAAIQLVGFFFMPESPRWLASNKREDEAYDVMTKIYGGDHLAEQHAKFELELIREGDEDARREKEAMGAANKPPILIMLKTPHLVKALVIGCSLQMFQQLSGINTVMYYSASIVMMSGISDPTLAIWLAAVTSGVNFFCTFIGIYFVEKIGRRLLLLCSIIGVLICLIILGIAFTVIAIESPSAHDDPLAISDACSSFSCDACSYKDFCGWCFNKSNPHDSGSCVVHSNESGPVGDGTLWAMQGSCWRNTSAYPDPKKFQFTNPDAQWYYGYCPTTLSWLPILGMVLYLCCFSSGYGPMPWTINAEIFPNWARSTGTSLSTTFNWLFNLLISLTFLTLARAITRQGAYFLYAAFTLIGLIWFYLVLPETKNKPIEDIQELLMGPWFTRGKDPHRARTISDRIRNNSYGSAGATEMPVSGHSKEQPSWKTDQSLEPRFEQPGQHGSYSNSGYAKDQNDKF